MGKLDAHGLHTRFLFGGGGKERLNSGPSDPSLLKAGLYQPAVTSPHLHIPNPHISFVVTLISAARSS